MTDEFQSMGDNELARRVTDAVRVRAAAMEISRSKFLSWDIRAESQFADDAARSLLAEVSRRMSAPSEPRPWGKHGPREDCLAWATWKGKDGRWVALQWQDADEDCHPCYLFDGEFAMDEDGEIDQNHAPFDEPPKLWLPMPPAPEVES